MCMIGTSCDYLKVYTKYFLRKFSFKRRQKCNFYFQFCERYVCYVQILLIPFTTRIVLKIHIIIITLIPMSSINHCAFFDEDNYLTQTKKS